MSSATWRRISDPVRFMFKTYLAAGKQYETYSNPDVKAALLKGTKLYQQYQQYKLLRENSIDMSVFLPIEVKALGPVLAEKLDLGDLDERDIDSMWKEDVARDLKGISFDNILESPIYSEALKSPRNITDLQARVLGVFAASCLPHLSVPMKLQPAISSFKWYLRLLANTPVVLILKIRRRLFSDDSLGLIDLLGLEFEKSLDDVRATLKPETLHDPDFGIRNYHFTHLSSSDLLALAIRSQPAFLDANDNFEQILKTIDWNQFNSLPDSFCDTIVSRNISFLQMPDGIVIPTPEIGELKRNIPLTATLGATDLIPEDLPYDLEYDDLYLLTIENAGLNHNLEPLLDAVGTSPFEVIGARVMLGNEEINNFFKEATESHSHKDNTLITYDDLILMAQKARLEASGPPSAAHSLFTKLGQWNQAKVTMGPHKNCIYLGPSS
ncbi:uncharacterized protein KQ657_001712 [Scheffersomyces spartinae]|uniref:Uncharacterized protein n=1 Tax=Scheffersomyces spartinae TaxID=45513 RepID=A0A9P8AHK4_9ASCO|nr:uncharacterized protein KQ657_001712 [Scheffersomyces spartinae]KAG7192612.1 hypothetical protein KQ657_001712 [Scheffersomyces spartinae]